MQRTLQSLRAEIDNLNQDLVSLLAKRFQATRLVGEYKRDNNLPARDAEREAASIARIREQAKEAHIDPDLAATILQAIMDAVVVQHEALKAPVSHE